MTYTENSSAIFYICNIIIINLMQGICLFVCIVVLLFYFILFYFPDMSGALLHYFNTREEDVTGVFWKSWEEDGGVQGEAGHASSGRLCSLWL